MNKLLKSKMAALLLVAVMVVYIIVTFKSRVDQIWMFADVFFAFMGAFTHLMAVTIEKMNPRASGKLEVAACIFGILFVIAFLVEFFVFQSAF